GVTVELTTDAKIADVVLPQIVAGNYPDVYVHSSLGNNVFKSLAKEHRLVDLTELFEGTGIDDEAPLKDQITTGVLESAFCNIYGDGRVYAASYALKGKGLVYNKALLEKYGWELPTTWDAAMALGEKAKAEGIALFTYQGIYPSYVECILFPTLASELGTETVTKLGQHEEGIITSQGALKVLGYYEEMAKKGYILEGTTGMDHTQSQTAFVQGKALLIPGGDWLPSEMESVEPCADFAWAMTAAFGIEEGQARYGTPSATSVCIPSPAANVELAKEFVRFLYTDFAVETFAQYQILGATKDARELGSKYLTKTFLAMHEMDEQFGNYIFGWAPEVDGSRIVLADEVYNPLTDVVNGKMTAADWAQNIENALQGMNNGQ
ncbi:MAG: extracellular solute-binding protein, partial [Clostridia bacterium]